MILVFLSPIQTLRVLPFDVASHTVLFQGFNSHRKHFRSWVFSLHSFFHFGNQIQSFIPKQIFFETIFETCSGTSGGVTGIVLSGGYILFWLSWCFPKMKSQAWWKSQNPFTNLLGSLSRKYRGCHSKRIMAAQACWCKHNADWKCWQIYQSQQKIIYTKETPGSPLWNEKWNHAFIHILLLFPLWPVCSLKGNSFEVRQHLCSEDPPISSDS